MYADIYPNIFSIQSSFFPKFPDTPIYKPDLSFHMDHFPNHRVDPDRNNVENIQSQSANAVVCVC